MGNAKLRPLATGKTSAQRVSRWAHQRDLIELYEILLSKLQQQKQPY